MIFLWLVVFSPFYVDYLIILHHGAEEGIIIFSSINRLE